MKLIPRPLHAVLDYLSVLILLGVPRLLKWDKRVVDLLTGAAGMTLGYSLLTRYELGVIRWLPMRAHLLLDAMSGVGLIAAPALLKTQNTLTNAALVGFGAFEVFAGLTSEDESADE